MKYTQNLKMKIPEGGDPINISDITENFETLDTEMIKKTNSSGGDISETVVKTLETIDTKYPIPAAGETIKRFLGKMLTFLKNIKPLESNVAYYVATTGSDTTGDGTSGNPYKTIQRVLSILPKDLGNFRATIYLADGVYPDPISISSFYNGTIYIRPTAREDTLSDACIIGNITTSQNLCHVNFNSLKIVGSGTSSEVSISISRLTRLGYVRINNTNLNQNAVSIFNMSEAVIANCEISNHAHAVYNDNSTVHVTYCTGSGNNYSVNVASGGKTSCDGTTPGYTQGFAVQNSGGSIFNQNGTQISGLINSNLSCTWGMIRGGYVRHGNSSGTAVVTVQIGIDLTTNLSGSTDYIIAGFPPPSGNANVIITFGPQYLVTNCYMDLAGRIHLYLNAGMNSGAGFLFGATYMTTT